MKSRKRHDEDRQDNDPPADVAQPSALIRAKLVRPRVRSGFIERPHLTARLDESLEGRVTLISAPAGYGKSTLVGQWLENASAPPSTWLSLDRLDGAIDRFSRYLVAALQQVEPDCLSRAEALFSLQNFPPPEYIAETIASEMEVLGRRIVLVLDDYSVVRGEPVHELVRSLVLHLPGTLHLVILTRVDPPLPLSLWRSRHWLHELRGVELRFSQEESRAFFDAAEELQLSDEAVGILHRKTEGWVAGLRLALLSLAESDDPEERVRKFSGSERLIIDYLMEEALASQPPEVREFLALTAPLERFCAPLCDELLKDRPSPPDSRWVLERLYRSNVFLFPLGALHGWYRYHHLFRELLLDRFDQLAPTASSTEISRRAGEWFAREGWLEEGLHYLLAAGDLDAAADLLADHLSAVINRDLSRRMLARLLAMFPPGAEHGRLPLIVASLYMMLLRFEIEAMLQLLEEAERTCRDVEGERSRKWWHVLQPDLAALWCFTLYWHGDPAGAHEHASRAISSTTDPGGYHYAVAIQYYGGGLALTGRRSEFLEFVDKGMISASARGEQPGLYLVVKTVVHWYWAELDSCRDIALESLAGGEKAGIPRYFQGYVRLVLGAVAYEGNLLDEAETCFRDVAAQPFEANRMVYHEALLGLAQVGLARGDLESAERYATVARDYARESGSPFLLRNSDSLGWRLDLATGRESTSPSQPPTTPDFIYLSLYPPSYSWAWLRLREPSLETRLEALRFIDETLNRAEAHGVEFRTIQLEILRAVALDGLGQRKRAVRVLEAAMLRAEPHGLVRSFLDCGERLREMLHAVASRNPGDTYVQRLIDAFDAPMGDDTPNLARRMETTTVAETETAGTGQALWEDLTNRELDVLELLQQRLSNKEIAARLFVSPATVKAHTLSIYGKLGVHGRRQAVAEAIKRKILARPGP